MYYAKPGNGAGGNCHVVLDDRNIVDSFIRFCLGECEAKGDEDGARIMIAMLEQKATARLKSIDLSRGP
jgi:hypothetical protein